MERTWLLVRPSTASLHIGRGDLRWTAASTLGSIVRLWSRGFGIFAWATALSLVPGLGHCGLNLD